MSKQGKPAGCQAMAHQDFLHVTPVQSWDKSNSGLKHVSCLIGTGAKKCVLLLINLKTKFASHSHYALIMLRNHIGWRMTAHVQVVIWCVYPIAWLLMSNPTKSMIRQLNKNLYAPFQTLLDVLFDSEG